MPDLPDVNVWVALSAPDHSLHQVAFRYWQDEAAQELCFCRVTALGLVRVISNPHTFGNQPLPPAEAWASYLGWRAQPECRLLVDPSGLEETISTWIAGNLVTRKNWTDLYLAAFARVAALRLVTFDRDLLAFPDVDILLQS